MCHEDFEEFYSEEAERDDGGLWYFRNVVSSDGSNYHPQCLQDKTLNERLDQADDQQDSKVDETNEDKMDTSTDGPEPTDIKTG